MGVILVSQNSIDGTFSLFKYSVGKEEKSDSVWPSFQERDDVARKVFVKR